jgi:hypothetical protein
LEINQMANETTARYTNWGQPYYAALARGHDHGSAAYIADQWEAKRLDQTKGTGIIQKENQNG